MARCDFCKSAELTAGTCPNCGRLLCNFQECHIISGANSSTELARISITDKYMMLYVKGAGRTVATASFGLLGALAAEVLSSGNRYGFYDLKEIEKVIYPYRNSKFKKDNALKIVNKDGSDLIIKQVLGAVSMDKIAACFKAGGVTVDSSCVDYGKLFCAKPFVDKRTMAARICPSAVPFVKPVKGNFPASSVSGQPASRPVSEPVKAEPVKQERQEAVYTAPAETRTVENQAAKEPVFTPPVQKTEAKFKFCFKCGNRIAADDAFCGKCGTRQ